MRICHTKSINANKIEALSAIGIDIPADSIAGALTGAFEGALQVIDTLKKLKELGGPILLHALTKKGKGYAPAEENQTVWHAPGMFDPETGERIKNEKGVSRYQDVFGEVLLELARMNPKVVGITPAMASGCGMNLLAKQMPERFYDVGMAEILILPSSTLIGRTIAESTFRTQFGVNVLGVRRHNEYFLKDVKDVRLHASDVVLMQGPWENISNLVAEDTQWVVLGQPLEQASKVTIDYKAPLAALIMILMVLAMALDFIPIAPVTAVVLAAVLMILTGCLRNVESAYKTINWESIILFGAMLPMSTALEKTGASTLISSSLVDTFGGGGPYVLMAAIYLCTSLMTFFISNTVTAVLMAPIALSAAQSAGVSAVPFLFAVTVAASMCFASPFSTPPNALVMSAGSYKTIDYIKVGLPLQIVMAIVMIIALPMIFPF